MKKNRILRKHSFITGAFISTLGIIISKVLGVVYVVPFHALVGDVGGALYGYAYSIYAFFIGISTAGIPLSVSKVTSYYAAKGDYSAKQRTFILARKMALILGFVSFLILIIFAPMIAKLIIGNLSGGNSLSAITGVIRIIALAVLVVPVLSIYRGYMQGHMIMTPPSISQVIEQIVRVTIIVIGSFLVIKVFKESVSLSVNVALLGALIGAICSYLYLKIVYLKNKNKFKDKNNTYSSSKVTNKEIINMIIIYAIPFIMIDIIKSLYDLVDMSTIVKSLAMYAEYTTAEAESVMSIISTWGKKFNMIVISVTTGIIMSLIPSLSSSIAKGDKKDINDKINDSFSLLLLLALPMSAGISILSYPIWNLFYGSGNGAVVLSYFVFTSIFISLFTLSVTIIQLFKEYKVLLISMLVGLLFKILLNVNLINTFFKAGLPPVYGAITASIIGYLVTFIICIVFLYKKYNIRFDSVVNNFIDIFIDTLLMSTILLLITRFIPVTGTSRMSSFLIILIYTIMGIIIYGIYAFRRGLIKNIVGDRINKLFKKN